MLSVRARAQNGASIMELLIGMTVGLIILAGASTLFVNYLSSNRILLLSTRLTEEMRAATELVERDLQRAGYWSNAVSAVYNATAATQPVNPYADITAGTGLDYAYALHNNTAVATDESFAFRLTKANGIGTLEMRKSGVWTAVTSPDATNVTAFTITPVVRTILLSEYCVKPCPSGSTTCPPQIQLRQYDLAFSAQAVVDPTIRRQVAESIRVRNDVTSGACPT